MLIKLYIFSCEVKNRVIKNDLTTYANSLTFKLILAIFPFIIAILSLLGFLNLSVDKITNVFFDNLPKEMSSMIGYYITDVFEHRRLSLLSSSAVIAIYSASAGIHTMIRAICNTFNLHENRNYIRTRIISICLMITFFAIIVATLYIMIFGDIINKELIEKSIINCIPSIITGTLMHGLVLIVMIIFLLLLYRFSLGKIAFRYLMPGILFTLISWFIVSKIFNIYVSNFSRYSVIYGSIGTLFVFAIWLFLLSYVILIGAQINAVLYDRDFMNGLRKVKI